MEELSAAIKELLRIQGSDGNWNHDPYMHGMYNGMELIRSLVDGDNNPQYKMPPKVWIKDTIPKDFVPEVLDGAVLDNSL